jgi:hypothetical protein
MVDPAKNSPTDFLAEDGNATEYLALPDTDPPALDEVMNLGHWEMFWWMEGIIPLESA